MNISRTSFKKPLLASALALAGLGLAGQAHAAVIAYGEVELQNFLVTYTGTATLTPSRNTTTSANADFGVPVSSGPFNDQVAGGTSNAVQASAGSGAFPIEGAFDTSASGFNGAYADSRTTGSAVTSPGSNPHNISSVRINGIVGDASSTANNTALVTFQNYTGGSITLTYDAIVDLFASVDALAPGLESAGAGSTATFTLTGQTAYTPSQLNQTVGTGFAATSPDSYSFSTLGGSQLTHTWSGLVAGNYDLSLLISSSAEGVSNVPEPATISLLGAGLVGLAAARRRKAKAKAEAETQA